MPQKERRVMGTDLALTRYVGTASGLPLESADSWGSVDLSVIPGGHGGLPQKREAQDIQRVSDRSNLAQALILRLLTPRGALTPLGHPQYGSRLVELVGQLNNERTRNLARLYTLQALGEELRVKEVLGLIIETVPGQAEVIRIGFSVLPLDEDDPLALSLEITL